MQVYREGHLNIVICAMEVSWQSLVMDGCVQNVAARCCAHEAHQNVCELSWPILSIYKFSMVDGYTEKLQKNTKPSKLMGE